MISFSGCLWLSLHAETITLANFYMAWPWTRRSLPPPQPKGWSQQCLPAFSDWYTRTVSRQSKQLQWDWLCDATVKIVKILITYIPCWTLHGFSRSNIQYPPAAARASEHWRSLGASQELHMWSTSRITLVSFCSETHPCHASMANNSLGRLSMSFVQYCRSLAQNNTANCVSARAKHQSLRYITVLYCIPEYSHHMFAP